MVLRSYSSSLAHPTPWDMEKILQLTDVTAQLRSWLGWAKIGCDRSRESPVDEKSPPPAREGSTGPAGSVAYRPPNVEDEPPAVLPWPGAPPPEHVRPPCSAARRAAARPVPGPAQAPPTQPSHPSERHGLIDKLFREELEYHSRYLMRCHKVMEDDIGALRATVRSLQEDLQVAYDVVDQQCANFMNLENYYQTAHEGWETTEDGMTALEAENRWLLEENQWLREENGRLTRRLGDDEEEQG